MSELSWEELDLMVDNDPVELRDRAWAEIRRLRLEVKENWGVIKLLRWQRDDAELESWTG